MRSQRIEGRRADERGKSEMNDELQASQASIERELLAWTGVTKEPGRFNSTAYLLGRREIGHIHGNRVVDLPFPRAIYDEMIASGRAQPHHAGVRGVVSVWLDDADGANRAIALLRMNYDRASAAAVARDAR